MPRLLFLLPLALLSLSCGEPPPPGQGSTVADSAPLVDRAVFFGHAETAYAKLAPSGQRLAFVRAVKGIPNLWVADVGTPLSEARAVTRSTSPVWQFKWSQDGQDLLFLADVEGDERHHLFAVDPDRPDEVRDLTPIEDVQARIVALPRDRPRQVLVSLNDRDRRFHDVYRIDLDSGERRLLRVNKSGVAWWMADEQGRLRLAVRVRDDGGTEILKVSESGLEPVYQCANGETCEPLRMAEGHRFYLRTNRGARDRVELASFDLETGEERLLARDPEGRADLGQVLFAPSDGRLLATAFNDDRQRLVAHDPAFARDIDRIRSDIPEGDLLFRSGTRDDAVWIVKQVVDTDSGPNFLYRREQGVTPLYRPYPRIPAEHMASMTPVRYPARDGLEISGYLTLPKGVAGPMPAVVVPHGGPWTRQSWGWSPLTQFLANRGYAVLEPNFRGSAGFGKAFLAAGNGQWGTGSMQHDLSDGVAWLIDQGIADPDRIAIVGTSYGGYAALAGVTFTPDLYAAGVSVVGPSSLLTLLDSIPPWWEPFRDLFHARVGDPSQPDQRQRLVDQSPLYSVDRVRAPLLIVQGANDPRVKRGESEQIVRALHARGTPVRYLLARDEGHGFEDEINRRALYAALESFLAEHLGGQAQADRPSEVAARLARLEVDPASLGDGEESRPGDAP